MYSSDAVIAVPARILTSRWLVILGMTESLVPLVELHGAGIELRVDGNPWISVEAIEFDRSLSIEVHLDHQYEPWVKIIEWNGRDIITSLPVDEHLNQAVCQTVVEFIASLTSAK
jgi:hypothetical protein